MLALDKAQETQQSEFKGIPKNINLKVRLEVMGPSDKMLESVAQFLIGENGQNIQLPQPIPQLLYRQSMSGFGKETGNPYTTEAKNLIKVKMQVIGTKDGKYINSNVFHDFVIAGGDPAFKSKKGNDVPSEAKRGQDELWALLCAANGVEQNSPQGQALKTNPQLDTIDGKEIVVRTGEPEKGNTKLSFFAPIYSVNDKNYKEGMSWGSIGQSSCGFGGAQNNGGFGNQQQQQTMDQQPTGGGWGG